MRREEENMNHDETLSFPNQRMRGEILFQSERERVSERKKEKREEEKRVREKMREIIRWKGEERND